MKKFLAFLAACIRREPPSLGHKLIGIHMSRISKSALDT
jgi:hypothetical protein